MIGHDVIWPKILPGPIRGLCMDARPKRGFWSWGVVGGGWFRPNIWSLLVLIEMRIRIKTRL